MEEVGERPPDVFESLVFGIGISIDTGVEDRTAGWQDPFVQGFQA
jgi:hypothetical protein